MFCEACISGFGQKLFWNIVEIFRPKEHQDTLPLPLETVAHGNTQCSDLKLDLCVSLKVLVYNSTSFVESHSVVQYFSKCCYYCQYKIII